MIQNYYAGMDGVLNTFFENFRDSFYFYPIRGNGNMKICYD